MAKRTRGSTTRPGQRAPLQRQPARPATTTTSGTAAPGATPAARPTGLTPAEEARAGELEAQIVAEERQAEDQSRQAQAARTQAQAARTAVAQRATTTLESTSADEYAYVARDVRRIAIVGGSLLAILFGLWVVAQMVGPITF